MASFTVGFAAGAAAGVAAYIYYKQSKSPSGFLAKVTEAKEALTEANVLSAEVAKSLLDSTPDALLLDVQDPGASSWSLHNHMPTHSRIAPVQAAM